MTPTGKWRMFRKPKIGGLIIGDVADDGSFVGTVFGDPIRGLWNRETNYVVFHQLLSAGGKSPKSPPPVVQYTGYLSQHPTTPLLLMVGEYNTFGSPKPGRGTWKAARMP